MTNQPKPEVKGIEKFRLADHVRDTDTITIPAAKYAALFAFAEEQDVEALTYRIRAHAAEAKVEEQGKEIARLSKDYMTAEEMAEVVHAWRERAEKAEATLEQLQGTESAESVWNRAIERVIAKRNDWNYFPVDPTKFRKYRYVPPQA